jgi:hypothetical protein
MPKFYVQCGPVEVVLVSESVDCAAIGALNRALQAHCWIYDDPDLTDLSRRDHLMVEALCYLDPVIRISEQGFDREDAMLVGTPETVEQWHHLMTKVSQLYVAAGLPPRAMHPSSSGSRRGSNAPRLPR